MSEMMTNPGADVIAIGEVIPIDAAAGAIGFASNDRFAAPFALAFAVVNSLMGCTYHFGIHSSSFRVTPRIIRG